MPRPVPSQFQFRLPQLPKPEYQALKKLCEMLQATQHEVVCVGLRLMCLLAKGEHTVHTGETAVRAILEDFRATAPSETPPLI